MPKNFQWPQRYCNIKNLNTPVFSYTVRYLYYVSIMNYCIAGRANLLERILSWKSIGYCTSCSIWVKNTDFCPYVQRFLPSGNDFAPNLCRIHAATSILTTTSLPTRSASYFWRLRYTVFIACVVSVQINSCTQAFVWQSTRVAKFYQIFIVLALFLVSAYWSYHTTASRTSYILYTALCTRPLWHGIVSSHLL